jgi:hypothetical protein
MVTRRRDLANTRHIDDNHGLHSLGSFMVQPLGLINRTKFAVESRGTAAQLTWL